ISYLQQGKESAVLSTGEKYGFIKINSPSAAAQDVPFFISEYGKEENPEWHFFGVLDQESSGEDNALPKKSLLDPFVSFGLLHGSPKRLAISYAIKAYTMEVLAWILLLAGISINVVFIFVILSLLRLL
ncbi:MAG: hypothetical protein LBI04_02755, partial [Treponema sp.]|nr:hypothetical protein [Treponema sp.]